MTNTNTKWTASRRLSDNIRISGSAAERDRRARKAFENASIKWPANPTILPTSQASASIVEFTDPQTREELRVLVSYETIVAFAQSSGTSDGKWLAVVAPRNYYSRTTDRSVDWFCAHCKDPSPVVCETNTGVFALLYFTLT